MGWSDRRQWRHPALARPTRLTMVGALRARVHAGAADRPPRPGGFPQGADKGPGRLELRDHSCGMTWAQIAIIPTNSAIDVSAAASSTKILNMACSITRTYEEHCSHFVLWSQANSAASKRNG